MFPYMPSEEENKLLDCYNSVIKNPIIGFDGIPEPHLQALNAVSDMVEGETRKQVVSEMNAAKADALIQVAEAASLLLLYADMAINNNSALRQEATNACQKLHELLDKAGYTEKDEFTGCRKMPGQKIESVIKFTI